MVTAYSFIYLFIFTFFLLKTNYFAWNISWLLFSPPSFSQFLPHSPSHLDPFTFCLLLEVCLFYVLLLISINLRNFNTEPDPSSVRRSVVQLLGEASEQSWVRSPAYKESHAVHRACCKKPVVSDHVITSQTRSPPFTAPLQRTWGSWENYGRELLAYGTGGGPYTEEQRIWGQGPLTLDT